ncbi:unnamed protein product [Fusarium graminearum]|uniref:NAD(P)-binding protein n=1 Tax=Gibberella zeae TaxID=5518 RepID=A0A9N8R7F8_GIBZA|nr:unnamed protein product [Fusarium graminearum]
MPTFTDVTQFLDGQIFGRTTLPDVDLSGRTIIVTGANTGLGLEAAKHIAKFKASKLILACQNIEKASKAASIIYDETKFWELDLAKYESTVSFAKRLSKDLSRLDGFLANAGVEVKEFELADNLELVRSKKKTLPELVLMPLIGWSAEYGSRTLVYALTAGNETHCCYISESQIKQESSFIQSEKGRDLEEGLWDNLIERLGEIEPDVLKAAGI